MSKEVHVAGIIVHAYPEHADTVAHAVVRLDGAQLHAAAEGRLIVTLEADSASAIAQRIDAIENVSGVLSCALVYQHNESLDAMMEELVDDDHAPRLY